MASSLKAEKPKAAITEPAEPNRLVKGGLKPQERKPATSSATPPSRARTQAGYMPA